jgi:hypothetical protein
MRNLTYLHKSFTDATLSLPVFDNLNSFEATTHFNGQGIVQLNESHATGISYCLAHHVKEFDGQRSLMIASICYLDSSVKENGAWYFARRKLFVDWIETRQMSSSTA